MSTGLYDVHLADTVISCHLDEALNALGVAVAGFAATTGLVRGTSLHATGVVVRCTCSRIDYFITPHDTADRAAWAKLIQLRVQRHWPTAAFSFRPLGRWSDTEHARVSWTDGPAPDQVLSFLDDFRRHPLRACDRDFDRDLTSTAWNTVAALAETSPSVEVPRTSAGEIDWATAATMTPPHGPANVAGFVVDTDGPELTVAELLRELARRVDLTHISTDAPTPITTPAIIGTDPSHPIDTILEDSTEVAVVGYLAIKKHSPLVPGTPVALVEPPPGTASAATLMALVETAAGDALSVAADGTVTRSHRYRNDPWRIHRVLYPVDRDPDTGGYILTRRPVTADDHQFGRGVAVLDRFTDAPTRIDEVYR